MAMNEYRAKSMQHLGNLYGTAAGVSLPSLQYLAVMTLLEAPPPASKAFSQVDPPEESNPSVVKTFDEPDQDIQRSVSAHQ